MINILRLSSRLPSSKVLSALGEHVTPGITACALSWACLLPDHQISSSISWAPSHSFSSTTPPSPPSAAVPTASVASGAAATSTSHGKSSGAAGVPIMPHSPNPLGPPGFVFDIDGVLIRGKNVLPAAKEAMAKLCPGGQWRYPVCFLTNGGGVLESRKAEQLSSWLHAPVSPSQIILSHTPMQQLVPRLGDQTVLVAGRGDVLHVAQEYGFRKVLSTYQLGRAMPTATPFTQYPDDLAADNEPCPVRDLGYGTDAQPIRAVLVMTDPSDWYRDLQLIIDVLSSRGVPTRTSPLQDVPPVELYFSNPDLLWANEFARNRYGQGAFAHIVHSLYQHTFGRPIEHAKFFGKPNPEPYRLAEHLLRQQAVALGLVDPSASQASGAAAAPAGGCSSAASHFSGIYAVGDNPAADVRGANLAGAPWSSVLVKTGVFKGPGSNCHLDPAQIVVDDVLHGVEAALHRTRSLRFHSMR